MISSTIKMGPYSGERYKVALDKITRMVALAQSGDRKAMSDIVHIAELHLIEGFVRKGLDHLHHLKGIEAADRARDVLHHGLHIMRENLSDTMALPFPTGHLQVNQTQTDTVRRDGSKE